MQFTWFTKLQNLNVYSRKLNHSIESASHYIFSHSCQFKFKFKLYPFISLTIRISQAISSLGREKFDAIYNYLKKTRFDDRLKSKGEVVDEKRVRHDLRTICSNSDLCAIVEQLLFLEMSGQG